MTAVAPEKLHVRKVNRIPRTVRLQGRACRRRGGGRAGAGARSSAGDAPARLEARAARTQPCVWGPGAHEAPASGFCPGGLSLASRSPRACTHSREEPSPRLRPRPRRAGQVRSSSPGSASLSLPRASLPSELTSSPASGPGALGLLWTTCARCGQISREERSRNLYQERKWPPSWSSSERRL